MLSEILLSILSFLLLYCYYLHNNVKNHFKKTGLCFLKGVPVFGNCYKSALVKSHFVEDLNEVYTAFPDERYVGFIEGTKPVILVRDPELTKVITVKDFGHFVDKKDFFTEEVDALLSESLLTLKGEKWREMRIRMTPAFTSSKMKLMMPFVLQIANNCVAHLKKHISEVIDVESEIQRYTSDVMASAVFGLEVNSFVDNHNQFFSTACETVNFPFIRSVYHFIVLQYPNVGKLLKFFGAQVIPLKCSNFFKNLVSNTIEYRKKNNIIRNDLLQMVMDVSDEWTENEIAGQIYLAFLAGFESTGSTITLSLHELALHPEIQERLYQEIKSNEKDKGGLSFDNINELKYLDAVINESLRKWTPAIVLDRVCTKPYILPPPRKDGKPYHMKPGEIVYNVVYSLQKDAKYYPNPETFDPDRFSDDNKPNNTPFTFMPFGVGPRNCIGLRLATMMTKVIIYSTVLNFKVLKCEKTPDPIQLAPSMIIFRAIGGTWVRLETRDL